MNVLRAITHHTPAALTLTDQAVVSAGNFLLGLLLARILGLDVFGVYSLGWIVLLGAASLHQALFTQPFQTLLPTFSGAAQARYVAAAQSLQTVAALAFGGLLAIGLWAGNALQLAPALPALEIGLAVATYLHHDFARRGRLAQAHVSHALGMDSLAYGSLLLAVWLGEPTTVAETYGYVAVAFAWPSLVIRPTFNLQPDALKQAVRLHARHGRWLPVRRMPPSRKEKPCDMHSGRSCSVE